MSSSVVEVDLYSVWLNVPEGPRPPGPYQILGLPPLEADQARIRLAYQRQDALLSRIIHQADRGVWETLRREVDAAYATLLDPERKSVVDASLHRKSARSSGPSAFSGAPSSAGATVICRQCRRENPAGRRFCGGCGQSLWEKCPSCGVECSADERFCGACGVEVSQGLANQRQDCEDRLAQAKALAKSHDYDAAITHLRLIAKATDPRFETYATRALAEIEAVERQRVEQTAEALAAFVQAQQFMAAYSYERAQSVLEETPPQLRTAEHTSLLAKTQSCRQELLTLGGEIRAAVEQKRTADLTPKLERLLALKPNHTQALQLADQLRDNLVKAAKASLLRCEYQVALDNLRQVPSTAANQEVETLLDTAGELSALFAAVELAPLADSATVALAERLCKLAPKNQKAAKIRDLIRERAKNKPTSARFRAVNWAPVPQRTWLDVPVDELAYFAKAPPGSDEAAKTLADNSGQFFVALGLALHAIEFVTIDADLTPEEKSGLLGKLPAISLGRRAPAAGWGIDLTDTGLRAIKLARSKDGVQVEAVECILHQHSLASASAESIRSGVIDETIREFAGRVKELKGIPVCIGLPGKHVLGRFFDLPPMPARKVAESAQYEARHQLPVALDQLCWSYAVLDPIEGRNAADQPRRLFVQAAREAHVRERISRFKAAGLPVAGVQSDCLALYNALAHEFFQGDDAGTTGDGAIAAIDVGAAGTNVVIAARRHVWFRSFGAGGHEFTRDLITQLQVPSEQIRELLREPARARRYRQWSAAIDPLAAQLGSEVRRSLTTYAKSNSQHAVQQAYLLGEAVPPVALRHLRIGR